MTTVTAQQTAADLLSAANLIDHKGWNQGSGRGLNGEVCAYIAIIDTTEGYGRFCYALAAMKTHVGIDPSYPLSAWNDIGGRTKEEVTGAFREAAEAVFPNG